MFCLGAVDGQDASVGQPYFNAAGVHIEVASKHIHHHIFFERIAEALDVSSSAIVGDFSSARPITTVGDFMGLLIEWHKAGILTLQGERMGGNLSPIGLALQPNPMLAQLLSLNRLVPDTGVKRVSWNNLFALPRNKAILFELLSWEMYYHRTQQLQEELAASEPGSHEYSY
jgi:hypothetical protein